MSGVSGVDALIERWAERGFNQSPVRKPRAKRGLTGLLLKAKPQTALPHASAAGVRAKIGIINGRTPQVMVRISGGGGACDISAPIFPTSPAMAGLPQSTKTTNAIRGKKN